MCAALHCVLHTRGGFCLDSWSWIERVWLECTCLSLLPVYTCSFESDSETA